MRFEGRVYVVVLTVVRGPAEIIDRMEKSKNFQIDICDTASGDIFRAVRLLLIGFACVNSVILSFFGRSSRHQMRL